MIFIRTFLIIFYKKVSFRYPLHALSIVFITRKTLIVNNHILLHFKTLPFFINIFLKIGSGKKLNKPTASYGAAYKIERVGALMRFITLKPGEKHEVLIKDAFSLLVYLGPFPRLFNGKEYELEVIFRDGYGDPGVRRKYVGRKDFSVVDQSPWR